MCCCKKTYKKMKETATPCSAFVEKKRGGNSDTIHLQEELKLEKRYQPHNHMDMEKKSDQHGETFKDSACREALEKEDKLVACFNREIECRDEQILKMQQRYDETVSSFQQVVNGLAEKINIKDKKLEEMEHLYQTEGNMLVDEKTLITSEIRKLQSQNMKWDSRFAALKKGKTRKLSECTRLKKEIKVPKVELQEQNAMEVDNNNPESSFTSGKLATLKRKIEYRDEHIVKMLQRYDETLVSFRQVENGLREKMDIKDKGLEEKERFHQTGVNVLVDENAKVNEAHVTEFEKLQSHNMELKSLALDTSKSKKYLECTRLEKEIKELKEKLQKQDATATVINNLESQISTMKTKLKEKLKALRSLESLNKTLTSELEEKSVKLHSLESHYSTLVLKDLERIVQFLEARNETIALRTDMVEKCDYLESINNALTLQEIYSRQELQEARSESIIMNLKSLLSNRTTLVFRRLGEIDRNVLKEACSLKFPDDDWEEISAKLCSLWEENLRDGNWHPFRIVDRNDKLEEIVDEDDERLKKLRDEYGEAVYKAVENALLEMNEHNPSGRYPVSEIWNSKEGRIATMKEIIQHLIKQVKNRKSKR